MMPVPLRIHLHYNERLGNGSQNGGRQYKVLMCSTLVAFDILKSNVQYRVETLRIRIIVRNPVTSKATHLLIFGNTISQVLPPIDVYGVHEDIPIPKAIDHTSGHKDRRQKVSSRLIRRRSTNKKHSSERSRCRREIRPCR